MYFSPSSSVLYASTKRLEDYPVYNASLSGLREGEGRRVWNGIEAKILYLEVGGVVQALFQPSSGVE